MSYIAHQTFLDNGANTLLIYFVCSLQGERGKARKFAVCSIILGSIFTVVALAALIIVLIFRR